MPDVSSLLGMLYEDLEYKLTITDVEASVFRVASFRSREKLSQISRYEIAVGVDLESIAKLEETLGRDATFAIERDGKVERIIHGIITDVVPDGKFVSKTEAEVTMVLEPRAANLLYSGGFRIFQNMAIHEIVAEICKPEQIECLWYVHPTPVKREYCTQFDESDFEFIARLASEEGMHFFFKHDDKKTSIVFVNEPDGYEEIEADLQITFNDTQGAVTEEHVRSIERTRRVRVGAFEHRDYDFLEPNKPHLGRAETTGTETTANSHKREFRDYPGRFAGKDDKGKSIAQIRLDELRSDAFVLRGAASSQRLEVGRSFTLASHRDEGFNRKLLLTYVAMEGVVEGAQRDAGGYRGSTKLTSFFAVPAEAAVHPQRIARPPSRLQNARVVGPKDGDPYVDERGRIKVQFFWDRDGKFNEKSSCWIRMATPAAHVDEGFWQAHKVGSEVLVGFLDDDIDRPIVVAAVYNAAQSQLYPLPAQVSKSVWRTKSIPGNAGFNEITQDNTAGKEEIYIHAQKDRRTQVLHNHAETVGANQSVSVGANQSISVGANRSVNVTANESISIGAHRHESVDKGEDVTVKEGRAHTIATGDDTLEVTTGNRHMKVHLADTLDSQTKKDTIEQTFELSAGTSIWAHTASGDAELKIETGGVATVTTKTKVVLWTPSGNITLADNKIALDAVEEIVLTCGQSSISLKNDGTIAISGKKEVAASSASSSVSVTPAKASMNGPMTEVTAKA
ncbi:MAG TPA: type VI secretion system tip protein TssI/VgrG, partial [Polyangiaceae bacterium]|nr:type VI secretion system tip protein TssI/VgrG [Polyangiaceae bacterium]